MPKRTKAPLSDDPDALVRREAGAYATADGRFEVGQGDVGWFLVDTEQSNEFGQSLMHGPFATLKAVRAAIAPARSEKVTPLRRPSRKADASRPTTSPARREPEPEPEPEPTWVDRLPPAEASHVRRLIAALERDGITDADALVRRDREGLLPAVATRLLERRLDAVVDDVPKAERDVAAALVRRIAAVLTAEGHDPAGPLPGWALVELGPEPAPPNRRIELE